MDSTLAIIPILSGGRTEAVAAFPLLDEREHDYLQEAKDLFSGRFYSYSLIAIWNAAVNNLKRRVEAYGVDLWLSIVKDEAGRKRYDKSGETISERWSGVDDAVLTSGATRLGLLNPKAGKALEMINWMRNHASSAHGSDNRVEMEDVMALVLILQTNLFTQPLPDIGHSIGALFDPIKNRSHTSDELEVLKDQIDSFRGKDIVTTFGFFTDMLIDGKEPSLTNVKGLFPNLWAKATEDLKKTMGMKYHTLMINPDSDDSDDKGAKTRIFEMLITLAGIKYIPEGTRARVFRRAAKILADAKDTSYGWNSEESAARNLAQLGTEIPSIAFEEVYQEIYAIWCGNYWGISDSHSILKPFINALNTDQIRISMKMFRENARVQDELSQRKPKAQAISLLKSFEAKLTVEAHKQELQETLEIIQEL